jgi:glycosyltransferase involved in cell wall biosynthesis
MHIVQIAPSIGPGNGVSGVAWSLGREFEALGHTVESFTMDSMPRRPRMPRSSGGRLLQALAIFRRMVWFTAAGTTHARRFLAERPHAVAICHNGPLAGDVYVNHGVVAASMQARGFGAWRMLRNPTHPFTYVRDRMRYRGNAHRAVVALTPSEAETLRRVYGRVRPPIRVIPNGVDLDRFHPPTADERAASRVQFQLDPEDRVVLFIGHEFRRKGLDLAIEALVHATTVLLLVVGGRTDTVAEAQAQAQRLGVADRVLFVGVRADIPVLLAASDIFLLPSAYESYGLVIMEALAAGLPVVATPVGVAESTIVDGENGYLVAPDAVQIAERLEELAGSDLAAYAQRARRSAEPHGWRASALQYLELLRELSPGGARTAGAEGRR